MRTVLVLLALIGVGVVLLLPKNVTAAETVSRDISLPAKVPEI